MEMLTLDKIKDFKKGDKVKITLEDNTGKEVSKQGTFYSIDTEKNEVLIKQYRKKKVVWIMDLNKKGIIEKIKKFENAKIENNFNYFH
ncbi:hypothetical protein [Clostridium botulinum]|uniref:hypothetical protein n=1 Tax=Clostridium botulinum TaxID=1491 RepID=UPI001C9B6D9E|nr:hypothetical protein [Clostridium botulinum]MBY6842814.1 hypothetical protein [Clostridium botulinum]